MMFGVTSFISRLIIVCRQIANYITERSVIVVLASPPPPVDPDDVNALTRQIFKASFSNFI